MAVQGVPPEDSPEIHYEASLGFPSEDVPGVPPETPQDFPEVSSKANPEVLLGVPVEGFFSTPGFPVDFPLGICLEIFLGGLLEVHPVLSLEILLNVPDFCRKIPNPLLELLERSI